MKIRILILFIIPAGFIVCAGCGSRKQPAPVVRLSSATATTKPIIYRPVVSQRPHAVPVVTLKPSLQRPYALQKPYAPSPSKSHQPKFQQHSLAMQNNRIRKNPVPHQPKHHFIWPHKGPILKNFGQANSKGIDIKGKVGMPVKASSGGLVVYSGNGLKGYGNLIIIKHDENFLTAYAHNDKLMVKEGERVNRGQEIAKIGHSGTDCVKLHFEVRYKGKPLNPVKLLPKA